MSQKIFTTTNTALSCAVLFFSTLPVAASVAAQSNTSADVGTQEMIVTANRLAQPLGETLAASTVFTLDDIEAAQAQSLLDLLAGAPGIQMARTGGQGTQTSLFMRGTNSDHTLILIDGVKANTASEGFARLENIPVAQIARIEVVRGPQSSLYGADAIGGVIQIFTKQAAHSDAEPGLSGNLSAAAGTESTYNGSGGFNLRGTHTSLALNVSHQQTDGIRPIHTPRPSARRSAYDNDAANLSIAHQFGNGAALHGAYSLTDSQLEYDGGINNGEGRTAHLGLRLPVTNSWQSDLQVSRFIDESVNDSTFASLSRTERDAINWQNHVQLGDNNSIVVGADFESEELLYEMSGATQTDTTRDNGAAFAVLDTQFALSNSSVDTTLSLRYDDNEQFGGKTTGKAAIGTDLGDNMQLWTSYSTAYKAPSLVELYVDFPGFFFFGNPDLQPETSRNVEIGLEGNHAGARWSINAFRNEIKNLITTDASFSSLTNVDRATINGAELAVSGSWLGWDANAALTLLDHENSDTGQELLRRPNEILSAGISREFNKLDVGLTWLLRGTQKDVDPVTFGTSSVAGNAVFDLAFSYQLLNDFGLQLKIGNLFDKDYQVVDGYNTYGRTALLTTRYIF
ncbi:TonB-dependent receptor domain-containing protein [Pseudohongiella sp.]|uniref:TonB-dependent vitamin B12 receptor n=1 Tax=marine sediment metagenome TaxID=412755 RepID=A0A0F9W9P8_9ZZZZ|nr:TonB-dependent receptor [Pseudohongiella sp.]HDZ07972.1 TonB-dependent receptor [Pseudohongiella sp.]HEA64421.1 TonB-dependent receptor [Pseudohongiella sp.]